MRKVIVVVLLVGLVISGVAVFRRRTPPAPKKTTPAPVAVTPKPIAPPPDSDRGGDVEAPAKVAIEADPAGNLRLEGRVVDDNDNGVGDAIVEISTNPRRTTRSEGDGSFFFDKLIAKGYRLSARKDAAVSGIVTVQATEKTDIVTLRLKQGASLEVTVVDADKRKPIAGATVELSDAPETAATTGADGKAIVKGVGPGFQEVEAHADGYAPASKAFDTAGTGGLVEKQLVEMRRGVMVSGRVVSPDGTPIEGARVVPESVSNLFGFEFSDDDAAITDAKGQWSLKAIPSGTFRFTASHELWAPGSSAPIALDGKTERKDVEIKLDAGAHIAGVVVDKGGQPVASAMVRVGTRGGFMAGARTRQAYSDAQGHFDLKGLPRKPTVALASHEIGSSDRVELDLAAKPEQTDVRLVLDVDGTIAGQVVDGHNQPVEGAQVTALPNFARGSGQKYDLRLRGAASDATDAGGRFELHGLPDGDYRLHATRGGAPMELMFGRGGGTPAKTGDKDVVITLDNDGKLKGKVLFADGTAPDVFTISVGFSAGTPFAGTNGDFALAAPAGKLTLAVSGSTFVRKTVPNVEVAGDKENDLGTITVERGRSISGRVVAADGTPVPGANVYGGSVVMGTGNDVGMGGMGGRMGVKQTESADDGSYSLDGVGEGRLVVLADGGDAGRSQAVAIPAGPTSANVDLTLLAPGSLEGHVTSGGQPVPNTMLIASPQTAARSNFVARTGEDGSYKFDKLTPDTYSVSAMAAGGMGMFKADFQSKVVAVQNGQTAELDIDIPSTGVTVNVHISPAVTTQVFLVSGVITPKSAGDLMDATAARGDGSMHPGFALKDQVATFDKITPGPYTVCGVPIPGDINDMAAMQQLRDKADQLAVYCMAANVAPAPSSQDVTVPVQPAVTPP